jgi:hypothetical protein
MNEKWLAILLMSVIFLSACSVEVSDQPAATLAATDVSESPATEGNNRVSHPGRNLPSRECFIMWASKLTARIC